MYWSAAAVRILTVIQDLRVTAAVVQVAAALVVPHVVQAHPALVPQSRGVVAETGVLAEVAAEASRLHQNVEFPGWFMWAPLFCCEVLVIINNTLCC